MMTPDEQSTITPSSEAPATGIPDVPPPPPMNSSSMIQLFETVNKTTVSGRPLNVTIVGVLLIIYAFSKLSSIVNLLSSTDKLYQTEMTFQVVFPIAMILAGIGVLTLKPWARILAIFVMVTDLICDYAIGIIYEFTSGLATDLQAAYGDMAVVLYVIGYIGSILYSVGIVTVAIYVLTRPNVKEAFARR